MTLPLLLLLAIIGAVYPPLNWPDEYRNLTLLQSQNYGFVYQSVQDIAHFLASGYAPIGPYDAVATSVTEDPKWQYMHGPLRYPSFLDWAPVSYYVAKLANVLLVAGFVLAFALLARTSRRTSRVTPTSHFVLSLALPGVSYQLMQVSTDVLFILMSTTLYFVRTFIGQLIFTIIATLFIIEDRSFAVLALIAAIRTMVPIVLPRDRLIGRTTKRAVWLLVGSLSGIGVGTLLAPVIIGGGSAASSILDALPGFEDAGSALEYTRDKGFNAAQSPVVMYAGLVYLPGATEFFIRLIPLYLVAVPVFVFLLRQAVACDSKHGTQSFYMLFSVLTVFFLVTHTTHVFEHGRYYYALAPLIVHALDQLLRLGSHTSRFSGEAMIWPLCALGVFLTAVTALAAGI